MKKIIMIVIIMLLSVSVFAQSEKNEQKVMKPALLVIDIQNQYKDFIPDQEREIGIYMMNAAIALFRAHDLPIIRIYHSDVEWKVPAPGTEEFEFWDGVQVDSNDAMVIKNYPDGFKKTDLEKLLKEKGINTLFLTGLSAVGCVLATYHGGMVRDYNTFLVKDAIMSHDKNFTDMIEQAYDAIGWDAMKFMIQYMRR